MTILTIILLILNIFYVLFFYFKMQKRFSNKAEINAVKQEVHKLMGEIAFQTEQVITILEDKLNEVNNAIAEFDRHILIAKKEAELAKKSIETMQNIKNNTLSTKENYITTVGMQGRTASIKGSNVQSQNNNMHNPTEPIKIYTKQVGISVSSYKEQILEMYRKGFSTEMIADKIPIPIGEIELIVSMNA